MKLDLTGKRDFSLEDCAALAKSLSSNDDTTNQVTELILDRIGIGPSGGLLISDTLNRTRLINLNLERNALGNVGGKAIAEVLATNTTLQKLNLSLNDLKAATTVDNGGATKALGDALLVNQTLKDLVLVRSGLGPKGGTHIANGLKTNASLISLDLTGNDLMAGGGHALGKAIQQNTTLKDLNLRWNRIGCGGDRGIESMAASLHTNRSLQKLDMSINELYSEGAIEFGTALKNNRSLTFLNLERNEIGAEGAIAISEALKQNNSLKRIILSGNPLIGDQGAVAIGQGLAVNRTLEELELVACGIGVNGAKAIGQALASSCEAPSCLSTLRLEKNKIGPIGGAAIAIGLERSTSLEKLYLSRNELGAEGAMALAVALRKNRSLLELGLASNGIEIENEVYENGNGSCSTAHIVESVADHPSLKYIDLCDNAIQFVPIDCQLKLARASISENGVEIDLSNNPLSSPPLGRRADPKGLKEYLVLLSSESMAVSRIRLMVLGFGGVGKSTFCDAVTRRDDDLAQFHASLIPLVDWGVGMIVAWAKRLGTPWAPLIASILETHKVTGRDLEKLVIVRNSTSFYPSQLLEDLIDGNLAEAPMLNFARAIGSLMRKGYFSTVGAIKVNGMVPLEGYCSANSKHRNACRNCSLIDFAGQMEYLVSHQLLLSSLHTICMILQPAPSFGCPENRHHGSWMYWSRFLRALGDRRPGSLLLAISQNDKVSTEGNNANVDVAIARELDAIRLEISNTGSTSPLVLDYRPEFIKDSMAAVRQAMSKATDIVARDWWVPASYEILSKFVRQLQEQKKSSRELPIISIQQLREELQTAGLYRMHDDPQLFQRGIEYLEAVGDVMADPRLDCLLLDPISWFASFLAHFIRDNDAVTSVQLDSRCVNRGVVSLENIVTALKHEYAKPQEQIPNVMSLVCRLELCIPYSYYNTVDKSDSREHYLFPCLLPPATTQEVAQHWPTEKSFFQPPASPPMVFRGHRFKARNGFLPPGLFPALLARCRHLPRGVMDASRMWKNCAVLLFGTKTRVILGIDLEAALIDVIAAAPTTEDIFLGGAKGQASATIWMAHVINVFLRKSYPQLFFEEAFLCPSPECHKPAITGIDEEYRVSRSYCGTEFPVKPVKIYRGEHNCEADGCWNQLGLGHKLETLVLKDENHRICGNCKKSARFALRSPC